MHLTTIRWNKVNKPECNQQLWVHYQHQNWKNHKGFIRRYNSYQKTEMSFDIDCYHMHDIEQDDNEK